MNKNRFSYAISGTWYGVELDSPDGLHDGYLNTDGQRYFKCKPQHGVFVRSQHLKKYIDSIKHYQLIVFHFV